MAYVPVPKDLSKVKTKVALNLTKRQIICFSLAGVCGLPVYFLTKKGLGADVAATLMVIVMLPFFFLAMYEKDVPCRKDTVPHHPAEISASGCPCLSV